MFSFKTNWFEDAKNNKNRQNYAILSNVATNSGTRENNVTSFENKNTGDLVTASEAAKLFDKINKELKVRNDFYKNNTIISTDFINHNVSLGSEILGIDFKNAQSILKKIFLEENFSITENNSIVKGFNEVRQKVAHFALKHKDKTLLISMDYASDNLMDVSKIFFYFKNKFDYLEERQKAGVFACTCDCNYCTCDCNYCTCDCNYCTCDCNYCTCNCNNQYGCSDATGGSNRVSTENKAKIYLTPGVKVNSMHGKRTYTNEIKFTGFTSDEKKIISNIQGKDDKNTFVFYLKELPDLYEYFKTNKDLVKVSIITNDGKDYELPNLVLKDLIFKLVKKEVKVSHFHQLNPAIAETPDYLECSLILEENLTALRELSRNVFNTGNVITAHEHKTLEKYLNIAEAACLCDCNYCTCDCNYCTCDCNYCTCDCNYCTCDCNYCTCDCNYCTCDCNYCTCDCNYCTCDCNYCTCNCNYGYYASHTPKQDPSKDYNTGKSLLKPIYSEVSYVITPNGTKTVKENKIDDTKVSDDDFNILK